jgi:hypothetical protein
MLRGRASRSWKESDLDGAAIMWEKSEKVANRLLVGSGVRSYSQRDIMRDGEVALSKKAELRRSCVGELGW